MNFILRAIDLERWFLLSSNSVFSLPFIVETVTSLALVSRAKEDADLAFEHHSLSFGHWSCDKLPKLLRGVWNTRCKTLISNHSCNVFPVHFYQGGLLAAFVINCLIDSSALRGFFDPMGNFCTWIKSASLPQLHLRMGWPSTKEWWLCFQFSRDLRTIQQRYDLANPSTTPDE